MQASGPKGGLIGGMVEHAGQDGAQHDAGHDALVTGTRHVPVLLNACMEALQPAPGRLLIDGTLGGGGHTRAMLDAGAHVIALDWDARAIERTQALQAEFAGRLIRVHRGYGHLADVLVQQGVAKVHGVLLDLGFSSDQLDDPLRGLSYHADGPLDMRLDSRAVATAADVLNNESEAALADILFNYGEEPKARQLAKAIVARRKAEPWHSTLQLRALIEEFYPYNPRLQRAHPAARIFQALRVAVNKELEHIEAVLPVAARALEVGGCLAVITFQPQEDRCVKRIFRQLCVDELDGIGRVVARAPFKALKKIEPSAAEIEQNPRARSAKLRVLQRVTA